MSFNDLKPIYKEFLLKLAVTLTKDELYQRSKSIMRRQKKKKLKRKNSTATTHPAKMIIGAFGLKNVFKFKKKSQLTSSQSKLNDPKRTSEYELKSKNKRRDRSRIATSGSEVSVHRTETAMNGHNRNSSSGWVNSLKAKRLWRFYLTEIRFTLTGTFHVLNAVMIPIIAHATQPIAVTAAWAVMISMRSWTRPKNNEDRQQLHVNRMTSAIARWVRISMIPQLGVILTVAPPEASATVPLTKRNHKRKARAKKKRRKVNRVDHETKIILLWTTSCLQSGAAAST